MVVTLSQVVLIKLSRVHSWSWVVMDDVQQPLISFTLHISSMLRINCSVCILNSLLLSILSSKRMRRIISEYCPLLVCYTHHSTTQLNLLHQRY